MLEDRRSRPPNRRLDSWKEIAAYFGRDERTVKRWEKERGLPVRRLPGARGGVYAFTDELSRWMEARNAGDPKASTETIATTSEQLAEDSDSVNSANTNVTETTVAFENSSGPHYQPPVSQHTVVSRSRSAWLVPLSLLVVLAFAAAVVLLTRKHVFASRAGTSNLAELKAANTHQADPKAKELYLQGRYYWNKRTPTDLNKALEYFQQAIAIDPKYACAYVGLADAYNLLREYSLMPEGEAYSKAIAAARKAIQLDDSLAEAHNSLAFGTFYYLFDAAAAEREFRRALDLNPNYALAHHWYATFLMSVGRNKEALEQIEIAQQLDASSISTLADKGIILFHAGQVEEATALLKQLSETEPSFLSPHRYLAEIYFATQKYPEYLVEARKAAQLSKDEMDLAILDEGARSFHSGGSHAMFESILREQKKYYAEGRISAVRLAQTCSMLGLQPEAIAYLRIAQERRDSLLSGILIDAPLMKLRDDPSYRELISQLGLPPVQGS